MADPEHVKILKQGVEAWNNWREDYYWLIEPDLSYATLIGMNLPHANLSETILIDADLRNTNLRGADLYSSALTGSNLQRANLTGVDLKGAFLNNANIKQTNLSEAVLRGADFSSVLIYDAVLTNADFAEVTMSNTAIVNTDLSEVKNLESIKHYGPSSIGIDSIYKSRGHIPEKFLRACGVPESFIVQIPPLVAAIQPIQFYSCFISYSSKDEEFAKRLYTDLQNEGVRCWFAPEDLKIGERFRVRIDESIRLYDRLLLVLSENSVSSRWVEKEVETAFEKEEEQKKTVLFPLRLDDAVLETKTGWAADVRRSRHIGDFREWKNHDSYRKAFDRLMRDLKAEAQR